MAALTESVIPASLARASVSQSASGTVNLRLNSGGQLALDPALSASLTGKQPVRTAVLPDNPHSAAVFSASQQSQSATLSDGQLTRLVDQITRLYTSASHAQLNLNAQITAVRPDNVIVQLGNGQTLNLPVRLDASQVGNQVSLNLLRQDGSTTLALQGTGSNSNVVATLTSPDAQQVRDVVAGALRNAGIRFDAAAIKSLPDAIRAQLPKLPAQGQMIQHQVTASEKQGRLTVNSVQLTAVGKVSLPPSTAPGSLGRIDSALLDTTRAQRLPVLNAGDTASAKTTTPPLPASGLTVTQQRDVQQQIVTLSRQLLNETGSTRTALNQLLQVLDMPVKNAAPATQALLTALQTRVRGLEQGMTFSSFKPDNTRLPEPATQSLLQGSADASRPATSTGLMGNMAHRMKELAGLLMQPATPAPAGEAGAQKSPTAPLTPLPQTTGEQIKALLNATPLPLSSPVLSRPGSGNDFVSALVTMLQFSLAGRAINRQPSLARQADRADSVLTRSMTGATTNTNGTASRVAMDMSQLDSRGMLTQSLKTLLSGHQQARLTNADNRLQGQDSVYYMLPTTGTETQPPEILIRRDQQGHSTEQHAGSATRNWHLTMKLDIGEAGELLAKSRINGETIELDLYASSEQLLALVADTLPFFTRRLEANGLDVGRTSFQLGKVPATLKAQPHHIFETMV
ncbi:flagellar hook-length control protein FliK [Alteromonas halophila]|uniref:flagellar hook-length control protein FliK n=1 Tax=Alteromonas halophila TaxID=516698 RepID=UPI0016724C2D|nr:flagellar hook-length control protein FliK [Alteromonas halophila]